jgi:hypothetical protein
LEGDRREAFTTFVVAEINANGGAYTIHKDSGLFSARNSILNA